MMTKRTSILQDGFWVTGRRRDAIPDTFCIVVRKRGRPSRDLEEWRNRGRHSHGVELIISSAAPEGTRLVKDIRPGVGSSNPEWLTDAYGTLFFEAEDGTEGRRLWKSNGAAEGTQSVGNTGAAFLMVAGDHLFFWADDSVHGLELWTLRLQ